MDKQKQRIISIVIGLVLAVLLVYIGFRVVQQRSSRASIPTVFKAERIDIDTCRFVAETSEDIDLLIQYGSGSTPTFYLRTDASNRSPNASGGYDQVVDVNDVSENAVTFMLSGNEDITTTCPAYSSSTGSKDPDTSAGLDAIQQPEPTSVPVQEPTATPIPDISDDASTELVPLSLEMARSYFEDNADADFFSCKDKFKVEYISYIHPCNVAWREKEAAE